MYRLLFLTIACLGLVFADGKPDFSGHWVLNLDQSKFGKAPKPTGMTLVATRNGDNMHAVQTVDSTGGPTSTEGDWIMDGKEHTTNGANPGKQLTKWEGNTLYSERQSADGAYLEKIWLTLSSDGKRATEKVWTKTPTGSNTSNLVWERR